MKLIIIRHAEPDYERMTITEKGRREAELLADRVVRWRADRYFVSPYRRARETAAPAMARLGREPEVLDWLREAGFIFPLPTDGTAHLLWDLAPSQWMAEPLLLDPDRWLEAPCLAAAVPGPVAEAPLRLEDPVYVPGAVQDYYRTMCRELDGLCASYGYVRRGKSYEKKKKNDAVLVFFVHLGTHAMMLSHLLNLSPLAVLQGAWIAPTGVTILGTEHILPGEAYFRIQTLGDVSHLHRAGEPVSPFGYFTDVFQG